MPVVKNHSSKKVREGPGDFALINVDGNGGMKIKIKEIKRKQLFINISVHIVEKSSVFMVIKKENIAAMTVT